MTYTYRKKSKIVKMRNLNEKYKKVKKYFFHRFFSETKKPYACNFYKRLDITLDTSLKT